MALIAICHLLDVYYSEKVFTNMVTTNTFNIGMYLKTFNNKQWYGKSFITNLLSNDFNKTVEFDEDNKPVIEKDDDIKNKSHCLSLLAYDPFIDNTAKDRIFLFNILAEYLTDDIVEDPHRLQSVVPLVKSILQESKFDKLIDNEQKNKAPNTDLIKAYVESKKTIRQLINQTANENGLSVKGSGRSARGASTLTGIMREMAENNFEEAKVNIFDVKMNGVYKQISDISNSSLFDQYNPQTDDFARMVITQRDMIQKFEEDKLKLEEQIRLLKLENKKINLLLEDEGKTNGNI